jgi:hypothetical protein
MILELNVRHFGLVVYLLSMFCRQTGGSCEKKSIVGRVAEFIENNAIVD